MWEEQQRLAECVREGSACVSCLRTKNVPFGMRNGRAPLNTAQNNVVEGERLMKLDARVDIPGKASRLTIVRLLPQV